MNDESLTRLVARIAVETGIPPQALIDLDWPMFEAIVVVIQERAGNGNG